MQEPTEKDLLVEFETQYIPEPYKAYYINKRHNFFSTIQRLPFIWNGFMHLDAILQREFDDTQRIREPGIMFPMILCMNAHQKMRVALELGCSTCLPEAHSMVRDAIEAAAHAHRLASDPQLLKPWLEKNDSEAATKVFKREFEWDKATHLFDGLPDLHKMWKQYSELGSHTNINSIVTRFVVSQTETDLEFGYQYLGGDPKILVPALLEILMVFSLIEEMVFRLAESRLRLDPELAKMRADFKTEKDATRQWVIKTYRLQPPSAS